MSSCSASAFFVLAATIISVTGVGADDEGLPFKITTKRDSDRVEVIVERDRTVFSVSSPFRTRSR